MLEKKRNESKRTKDKKECVRKLCDVILWSVNIEQFYLSHWCLVIVCVCGFSFNMLHSNNFNFTLLSILVFWSRFTLGFFSKESYAACISMLSFCALAIQTVFDYRNFRNAHEYVISIFYNVDKWLPNIIIIDWLITWKPAAQVLLM